MINVYAGIVIFRPVFDVEKLYIGGRISAHEILIADIKDSVNYFFEIKSHEAIVNLQIEKSILKKYQLC